MTQAEKSTMMERIRKLLALGASNNPNEAAAALVKAQALLLQYNLSLEEIERLQSPGDPLSKYDRVTMELTSNRRWRKALFFAVARANLCRGLEFRGTSKVTLIGEPHNIEAVRLIYSTIEPQIETMAAAAFIQNGRGAHASWINSFCYGCVETIQQRFDEERQHLTQPAQRTGSQVDPSIRALVIRVDAELAEKEKQLFPKLGKPVQTVLRNGSAREQGREAGHSVTWKKQIGASL